MIFNKPNNLHSWEDIQTDSMILRYNKRNVNNSIYAVAYAFVAIASSKLTMPKASEQILQAL